jgi:hypothetical protein
MSAYIEDICDVINLIESSRDELVNNRATALRVGTNIALSAQGISCVGEKALREFLYNKGKAIVREVGDDDFYTTNHAPDFHLIKRIIDEVYDRLKLELVSG